jgi:thiamine pyrophosphate-dependent acetolactate synthase large subunit-like protein
MTVADAVAQILQREGVEHLTAYPNNPIIDAAAAAGIRPIIVRQERSGVHMADGFSRVNSGRRFGVFAMQGGPGAESAFGAIAQAFAESVPILALPNGYTRSAVCVPPNFNAFLNFQHVTKSVEQVTVGTAVPAALRRAFARLRNGRPGPVMVEIPTDVLMQRFPGQLEYRPGPRVRTAPDPADVDEVAAMLVDAERLVVYAGQGVHYARAWSRLRELAELLQAPVATSLAGKSAFPEDHALALGSAGRALPRAVHHFLQRADVILGIGCSFGATAFGVAMPASAAIVHCTLDPFDLEKDTPVERALLGDAALVLDALLEAVRDRIRPRRPERLIEIANEIASVRGEWLERWLPKLQSDEIPISPYRVIWELGRAVDLSTTVVTHDAGSPRDQLSPFWVAKEPLSYLGWGKMTQLGYGLGLAMGAKLAAPDKLCINVWGDAAIGFTGMDLETAVRERIPILSVLLNNSGMAAEAATMPAAAARYGSAVLSGNYAEVARGLGLHAERVCEPGRIAGAIRQGVEVCLAGTPVLLEFITSRETDLSLYWAS